MLVKSICTMLPITLVICSLLVAVTANEQYADVREFTNRVNPTCFMDTKDIDYVMDGVVQKLNGTVRVTKDLGEEIQVEIFQRIFSGSVMYDANFREVVNICDALSGKDESIGAKIVRPLITPFGQCPIKKGDYPFIKVNLDIDSLQTDVGDRFDIDFTFTDPSVIGECILYMETVIIE